MLETSKGKRKHSKVMTIILLPVLTFLFIIGWFMYWVGNRKRSDRTQRKPAKKDNVTILPIALEENQEILNE